MKLNKLMVILMSCGVLAACQNQSSQPGSGAYGGGGYSRIKLAPSQQWHRLQEAGYHGAMPDKMSGYLLLGKDSQQRHQTKQLLKAQLQHDPTGEKELLYIANLMPVIESELEPGWVDETREVLWSRQQRKGDVIFELITFYARDPQQPGYDQLIRLIRQSDKRLAANQRFWLWALVRLPDVLKTQITPAELHTLCQQVSANTPAFGYVRPSNLQLCRRAQLMAFRHQMSQDWPVLFADIGADIKAARLQNSDLLPFMEILQNSSYGTPMSEQAIALGRLADPADHAITLTIAALLLNQSGSDEETTQLEQQLLQFCQQGEKQASYLLARLYLEGRRKVADPAMAEKMLQTVTDLPEASYLLGRLYLSGMLGEPSRVQQGVNLLLQSARQGYTRADMALAEAFHHAPGVKANPVYAWVFASLVLRQHPDSQREQQMLTSLALDPAGKQQAGALLQQERQARVASHVMPPIAEPLTESVRRNNEEPGNGDSELVNNF